MPTRSWHSFPAVAALGLILALAAPGAGAAGASLPDNADARALLGDVIFAPVREAAAARARSVRGPETGEKTYFRAEVKGGSLYLVFSRFPEGGETMAAAGTFIIKRAMKTGEFIQAKLFLQDDPGFFVRFFPAQDRSAMEVFAIGETFHREVMIAMPFDRLLTAPFSEIRGLTSAVVDWDAVLPAERTQADARVERIVSAIRPRLAGLADVEDGAMDGQGRFVFIADERPQNGKGGFNCSGFSKFVVDGFFKPLTGSLLGIEELKARDPEGRKNPLAARYEEARDSYFGLDWSRNLARYLEQARGGGPLPEPAFADVTDGTLFPYRPDIGYPIADIQTVLYHLWRQEPGSLYLGTVSKEASDGAPVRQYHHIAVFFPYRDGKGSYRLVVMERNLETSTASLQRRFPGEFVHLVRIATDGTFILP
jgi:hypothetical protein